MPVPQISTPRAVEARAQREHFRQLERANKARESWRQRLTRSQPLADPAEQLLASSERPKERELWLLLGVFETEEKAYLSGAPKSVTTRAFDRITPRVRDGRTGVSGFAARTAAKLPSLFQGSRNGYVYLTDLGYAVVEVLRKQNPSLLDLSMWNEALYLRGVGEVPRPTWRRWSC